MSVEFPYLIEEDIVPFFHSYLPRNKEQQDAEERTLRLLLLKTTTCPLALINPTCRYYFAYYPSSQTTGNTSSPAPDKIFRCGRPRAAIHAPDGRPFRDDHPASRSRWRCATMTDRRRCTCPAGQGVATLLVKAQEPAKPSTSDICSHS